MDGINTVNHIKLQLDSLKAIIAFSFIYTAPFFFGAF